MLFTAFLFFILILLERYHLLKWTYLSKAYKTVKTLSLQLTFPNGADTKSYVFEINWTSRFGAVSLRNRTAKGDGAITCVFCRDGHFTPTFSGPLQKDLFKEKWNLAKSCFKQNYCHACNTTFAVFFRLPSCCVSSLPAGGSAFFTQSLHFC